ncbi:unnamed protein product [Symbiodinium sp. CCMP2456]|nr:unnamed protein product [Symbiodinium sp. CCMP2456]
MGQSSSGEPKRELLYAEDGITVIGSTFSTGGEEAAPEWFGMGPQSLGFVGPGPQINPKVYCTPQAQNRLLRPRNSREEAPNLTVFNRSPRPVNVSLGDGKHFLQPGHLARFVLPDVEAALFVTDPCSGLCLCDLRGLPAGGQPFEALPHAILREVGGALSASLDYSFPRMEDAPDPSRKLSISSSVCETLEGSEHKASPRTIELEEQLLEALQCNDQCRAQEILAAGFNQEGGSLRGNVEVRSIKREGFRSKVNFVLQLLADSMEGHGSEATGLFVDDDIKELTEDCEALREVLASGRLLRLLFVRSGGKE